MKRIVIHAGFPKCGSTSVFAALKHGIRDLGKRNIFILNNHFALHRTKDAPIAPRWEIEKALKAPDAAERMRTALLAALGDCPDGGTIIICSENLADPRKARLFAGLEQLCGMELVFYFRPQAQWIASAWKQWDMKSGATLPETVKACIAAGRPDYLGSARGWEKAIAGIRITPRPFLRGSMTGGHPSYDFLKLLGVEARRDPALEQRANPSMDYALLHLLQRNSAALFKDRHDNALIRGLIKRLPEAYRSTNAPMLSQRESDVIADHFHADNVALMQHYVGMDHDQAEAFVRQHFHETVTGRAFTEFPEGEILARAGMIMKEITGRAGNPDQQLLDYRRQL